MHCVYQLLKLIFNWLQISDIIIDSPSQSSTTLHVPFFSDENFQEEKSDNCMMSLLGKGGYGNCTVDVCWKMMTKMKSDFYYTTHQLLWLQIGIKVRFIFILNSFEIIVQQLYTYFMFLFLSAFIITNNFFEMHDQYLNIILWFLTNIDKTSHGMLQ